MALLSVLLVGVFNLHDAVLFDTLNAPTDKLLLFQLGKLGGYRIISDHWRPLRQINETNQNII